MSTTSHVYCVPSGCAGLDRFRTNTNNPAILKKMISSLTNNRANVEATAFASNRFNEKATFDISLPPNIVADYSNLPIIPQSPIAELGACVSILNIVNTACTSTDLYTQFLCLINFLAAARYNAVAFSSGDPVVAACGVGLKFYAIFDGKLAFFYGTLEEVTGDLVLSMDHVNFLFPPEFVSFSFGLYNPVTDTYYVSISL